MKTILKIEDLEKVYRVGSVDVPALRGVSLDVEEGEFVAIMGPSGCGKSTMLHLLGGLLTPTSGRIVIDDEDLTAATDARRTDIRRRKIGFVFQRFNLFPTLTAEGNLKLAERIHGGGENRRGDPERRRNPSHAPARRQDAPQAPGAFRRRAAARGARPRRRHPAHTH